MHPHTSSLRGLLRNQRVHQSEGSPQPEEVHQPEGQGQRLLQGWRGQAVRFAVVGGVATALHYGIYLLLMRLIPSMPPNPAYVIGYVCSFICNFYGTALFTFRVPPSWGRLAGMAGAHAVNFLLHMGLLNLYLWIGIGQRIAPVPVYAVAIPVNFLLVKYVFKKK